MTAPDAPLPAAVRRFLERDGRPMALTDLATGVTHPVSLDLAAAPDGLLPAFLAAGEAVWRSATGGRGFGLRLAEDRAALLGWRAEAADGAPLSVVLLATLDAIKRAGTPEALPVNDLNAVWREAAALAAEAGPEPVPAARPAAGPSP